MAEHAEPVFTAKDVEEAVQRGIQRGIASVRSEGKSSSIIFSIFRVVGGESESSFHLYLAYVRLKLRMEFFVLKRCLALTTDLRLPSVTSTPLPGRSLVSGTISRARDLLRSNIGSISSSLEALVAQQPKRRRIGHHYAKKSEKQPQQKTLEVSVVDFMALEEFVNEKGNIPQVVPDYNLGKEDILFCGTVDLMTNDKEYAIRSKITEVLATRIPGILPDDFSFVKVSRKQVCSPVCKEGHKWDFPQVKTIAGQGKLYVRLQKPKALIGVEKPSTLSDLPSTCTLFVSESAPDVQPLIECFAGGNMSASSLCDPQPSTSLAEFHQALSK